MRMRLLASALLLTSCDSPPSQLETPGPEAVLERFEVTRWTDSTELLMEYPALRQGEESRFTIHLTDLNSFEPLRHGQVGVHLDHGDGLVENFSVDSPAKPGVFEIPVVPARSGLPAMSVKVQAPSFLDTHDLGPTPVRREGDSASNAPSGADEPGMESNVVFVKEQQWTLGFATEPARLSAMQESLLVPALIEPRNGARMVVTAPVPGRLLASVRLPALGALVSVGEQLGAIVPLWSGPLDLSSLRLSLAEAGVAVEAARRERKRVEKLLAAGAIPARRLDEAKDLETVALARHQAAEERMTFYEATRRDDPHSESEYSFSIRSHLAGIVTSVFTTDGAHVEEGDFLLEIAAIDSVHVSAALPESQAAVLRELKGAEIQLAESQISLPVRRLVSIARVVDPETRTLKVTYLVNNSRHRLALGQSAYLRLFTSRTVEAPTVPLSALVDDRGQTRVFVQIGGESFEGRAVTLGNRQGGAVQITEGIREGERVVTKGAYLVRLASIAVQPPAHGHVH